MRCELCQKIIIQNNKYDFCERCLEKQKQEKSNLYPVKKRIEKHGVISGTSKNYTNNIRQILKLIKMYKLENSKIGKYFLDLQKNI